MRHQWDAQELFNFQGTLIWVIQVLPQEDQVMVCEFPEGEPFLITIQDYKSLKSAEPDELEEAGI